MVLDIIENEKFYRRPHAHSIPQVQTHYSTRLR